MALRIMSSSLRASRMLASGARCMIVRPLPAVLDGRCCVGSVTAQPLIVSSQATRHQRSFSRFASTLVTKAAQKVAFEPESLPTVSQSDVSAQAWAGDLIILAVTEEDFISENEVVSIKSDALKALDADFGGVLSDIVAEGGFEGKQGSQSKVLRVGSAPGAKAKTVALVGLGKADKITVTADWGPSPFQALGSAVATLTKASKSRSVGLAFVSDFSASKDVAVQQVTSGALLGGYETLRFKTKKSPTASKMEALHLLMPGQANAAIAKASAIVSGATLTRYLVEAPPNVCTPSHLADAARHIAERFPSCMTVEILDKAQCEALGMTCFLAVSEASEEPPQFIHLTYRPAGASGDIKKVGLVGKGLTFDSGGYNIKAGPGSMIELMKFDMGGSGATLGAARIVAEVQPPNVEVHFIVAACENMIAGKGLRPGDVVKTAAGKSIEVNNTDAEGRLTLADALWFAQEKCGVTAVVDTATLTGSCLVALGPDIAGLFTPSDKMADSVAKAAKVAGEKMWRLPMESSYFDTLKSSIADMRNTGSRYGGAISAALFLKQFIKDDVEWAHIDCAGPVWDEKQNLPTGFGAATLAEWAAAQGQAQ